MSSKFTIVRLTMNGTHLEILVSPDNALSYKMGRKVELSQVLAVDEVYSDASKGLRIPSDKLMKYFHTSNILEIAEIILKKGVLQLTAEQRRRLVEDKRKQIITIIARNFIDPRTGLPHPPTRIEQAMQEARISIDAFKDAEEQAKLVVDQLRTILPLKSERLKLLVRIPPQFAPQGIGVLKGYGDIQREEWGANGSLTILVEIPAGIHSTLIDKLGSITKGSAQASLIR